MTTLSSTDTPKLKINRLTKTQMDNASNLSTSELYMVDLELTGNKMLVSKTDGDIAEGDISDVIPVSAGDVGKALVTDGTDASWQYSTIIKTWID